MNVCLEAIDICDPKSSILILWHYIENPWACIKCLPLRRRLKYRSQTCHDGVSGLPSPLSLLLILLHTFCPSLDWVCTKKSVPLPIFFMAIQHCAVSFLPLAFVYLPLWPSSICLNLTHLDSGFEQVWEITWNLFEPRVETRVKYWSKIRPGSLSIPFVRNSTKNAGESGTDTN